MAQQMFDVFWLVADEQLTRHDAGNKYANEAEPLQFQKKKGSVRLQLSPFAAEMKKRRRLY